MSYFELQLEDIYLPIADWLYTKIRMHKHTWPQTWMYMNPSVCVKRIHQFSLQPLLCLLLGSHSFLTGTNKRLFAAPFMLYTHTPANRVSSMWSAAKGTFRYFSSLNSLFHNFFEAKTEKNWFISCPEQFQKRPYYLGFFSVTFKSCHVVSKQ